MSKIGRNELCPCGSGRKYKKCCIDKPEQTLMSESLTRHLQGFLTYGEVNEMSTSEIIKNLKSIGILFDKDAFLSDVEKFYSAEQISDNWFKTFKVTVKGRERDFPWFAAWILWERLAPPHILSMERMSVLINKGAGFLAEKDTKRACDVWLKVWEALKNKLKPGYNSMDYLDKQYSDCFFVSNFCQDLEMELHNAGLDDKTYFEKRIKYSREFLDCFPNEEELIIYNARRDIAESYSSLGNYEQAEWEYQKLVRDYPDNPWSYISWGDMYFLDKKKDLAKAKKFYEKALALAQDETDMMAVQERLEDLECKMGI